MQTFYLIFFNPTQPNPIYQRINDRALQRKFESATAHHVDHAGTGGKVDSIQRRIVGTGQGLIRYRASLARSGGASGIDRSCATAHRDPPGKRFGGRAKGGGGLGLCVETPAKSILPTPSAFEHTLPVQRF